MNASSSRYSRLARCVLIVFVVANIIIAQQQVAGEGFFTPYSEINFGGDSCTFDQGGVFSPGFTIQSYEFGTDGDLCTIVLCNGSDQVGVFNSDHKDGEPEPFDHVQMNCDGDGTSLVCSEDDDSNAGDCFG